MTAIQNGLRMLPFITSTVVLAAIASAGDAQSGPPGRVIRQIDTPAGPTLVAGNGVEEEPAVDKSRIPRIADLGGMYVRGQVYVRFESNVLAAEIDAAHARAGAQRVGWHSRMVPGLCRVAVAEGTEQASLDAYNSEPSVKYATPSLIRKLQTDPNDTRWPELWGMHGAPGAGSRAQWAWDDWAGYQEFVIAVIDSGVNINHTDLADNIWTNPDEGPGDANGDGRPGLAGVDDDGDGRVDEDSQNRQPGEPGYNNDLMGDDDENGYVDDFNGWDFYNDNNQVLDDVGECGNHGTHVAGTIGARGNNGVGVVGVNWQCRIMPLQTSLRYQDGNGVWRCGLANTIEALDYAVTIGAKVSNNSYGNGYDSAQYDSIRAARDAGHIFVAAAGNGGQDGVGDDNDVTPTYPASYDLLNIISVANLEQDDTLAGSSNYGDVSVDIAAPGTGILSTVGTNDYAVKNGTSMASPHVAGAVALTWSHWDGEWWEIVNRVLHGRRNVPGLNGLVRYGGALNCHRASAIWVNFNWGGIEYGTFFRPYNTFAEGLGDTPQSGLLSLMGGSTNWTGTIGQALHIQTRPGMPAVIGQ